MSYWSDRVQKEREVNDAKSIAEYQKELESLYRLQLSELRKELESYIQRYADKEGVTTSEARKRADNFDIKAFEDKAKKYVEEKDFSAKANRELRDYNFSMSVERQELLIQSLELELTALADAETKLTRNFLENGYKEEIARGGLLSQSVLTGQVLQSTMKAAVDANFQGAKWSDRIWAKQNQLKKLLATEVTRALIRGDNGTAIARKIRKVFDVSVREARRLAITELTRVQTMAQKYTMERNGFTHFILMPEGRACETCKQIGRDTAREPVSIEDMEIGLNAPPIHPHCRCAVAEEYVEERVENQENSPIPEDTPYKSTKKEWLNHSGIPKVSERTYWKKGSDIYSVDGKNVVLDYSVKEKEVAEWLAETFKMHIELVPKVNSPQSVSTPDYLIDGVGFDLKEINKTGKNNVDGAIKSKKEQARHFVLDVSNSPLSVEEFRQRVNDLFFSKRRSWVKTIILIKSNELIDVFERK